MSVHALHMVIPPHRGTVPLELCLFNLSSICLHSKKITGSIFRGNMAVWGLYWLPLRGYTCYLGLWLCRNNGKANASNNLGFHIKSSSLA